MNVNMYFKHVMLDVCEWLQVVASDCSWLHNTHYALDRLRHIFILHMHECLYLFMDEIECVII